MKKIKNKYIYLGDNDSINIELLSKSFKTLKNKVKYIIIGNKDLIQEYLNKIKSNLDINEILDPFNFDEIDINKLNIFNYDLISKNKGENLINQLKISNFLSNITKYDLITLPVDKSIIKNYIEFNGITEFLGSINNKKTIMLMKGEVFSIIPITTHINLNEITKNLKLKLSSFFDTLTEKQFDSTIKKYKKIIFLCINPHCSEEGLLGKEDFILKKFVKSFFKDYQIISADSAFNRIKKGSLFISLYHDQALIPFKIINKFSINETIGLSYKRYSPAHGPAKNIKFQNLADNTSYLKCMEN